MSLKCHQEGKEPPPLVLHPFEDIRVWLDDIALDDDGTPLWIGDGALSLDGIIIPSMDVAHSGGDVTLEMMSHLLEST
jgi:hypothetical protein